MKMNLNYSDFDHTMVLDNTIFCFFYGVFYMKSFYMKKFYMKILIASFLFFEELQYLQQNYKTNLALSKKSSSSLLSFSS